MAVRSLKKSHEATGRVSPSEALSSAPGPTADAAARASRRDYSAPLSLALFFAVLATFWPSVNNDFINYDDPDYVTANTRVQQGLTWQGVAWAFGSTREAANWHPLTWLSHLLDYELFGPSPRGHHQTSVLLHSVNVVLLFLLLNRLTGEQWRSLVVAALFGLHPLRVESVAWIAERKDVLSAFFFLLTLLAYARYVAKSTGHRPQSAVHSPQSTVRSPQRKV